MHVSAVEDDFTGVSLWFKKAWLYYVYLLLRNFFARFSHPNSGMLP